eukprot:COSAG02_NODE_41257_length_396_cov_1.107744_1_plen_37_part_10
MADRVGTASLDFSRRPFSRRRRGGSVNDNDNDNLVAR